MSPQARRAQPWALAIDFGTSATAAVIAHGSAHADGQTSQLQTVKIGGEDRMPSMVFWRPSDAEQPGELLVGSAAEAWAATAPANLEPAPKRRLRPPWSLLLGGAQIAIVDAVARILHEVSAAAITQRADVPPGAVNMTHPARWLEGGEQLRALADAAARAGVPEPVFMSEPEAAAVYFAREQLAVGEHVAVFDFGGGTLDTAVLERTESGFELAGPPGGNAWLGGEDFDHRLYEFIGSKLPDTQWDQLRNSDEREWKQANRALRREARRAKEVLSRSAQCPVYIPMPVNRDLLISLDQLRGLIEPDVESSAEVLADTVAQAGLDPQQLAAVYLAGGSSYIPLVSRVIAKYLEGAPAPSMLGDPKLSVAQGAAAAAWQRLSEDSGQSQRSEASKQVKRERPEPEKPRRRGGVRAFLSARARGAPAEQGKAAPSPLESWDPPKPKAPPVRDAGVQRGFRAARTQRERLLEEEPEPVEADPTKPEPVEADLEPRGSGISATPSLIVTGDWRTIERGLLEFGPRADLGAVALFDLPRPRRARASDRWLEHREGELRNRHGAAYRRLAVDPVPVFGAPGYELRYRAADASFVERLVVVGDSRLLFKAPEADRALLGDAELFAPPPDPKSYRLPFFVSDIPPGWLVSETLEVALRDRRSRAHRLVLASRTDPDRELVPSELAATILEQRRAEPVSQTEEELVLFGARREVIRCTYTAGRSPVRSTLLVLAAEGRVFWLSATPSRAADADHAVAALSDHVSIAAG